MFCGHGPLVKKNDAKKLLAEGGGGGGIIFPERGCRVHRLTTALPKWTVLAQVQGAES